MTDGKLLSVIKRISCPQHFKTLFPSVAWRHRHELTFTAIDIYYVPYCSFELEQSWETGCNGYFEGQQKASMTYAV